MQTTFAQQSPGSGQQPSPPSGAKTSRRGRRPRANAATSERGAAKVRGDNAPGGDRSLIEALCNSKLFHDYEKAFTEATGLPVALCPVESWQLPHHGQRNES